MIECPDGNLRDLLPEYMHGALPAEARARVGAHLAGCASCRDELALLRAVRASQLRPGPADVARIVATLPRPVARARSSSAGAVTVVASHPAFARAMRWRRIAAIAAVLVGAVGVGVVWRLSSGDGSGEPIVAVDLHGAPASAAPSPGAMLPPGSRVASVRDTPVAGVGAEQASEARRADAATDAVGALGGIASGATEDELEALIGQLESLTGIPEVESVEGQESARITGADR